MTDVVVLLARVNERWAEFLRDQTEEQLLAFADGRLCLSFVEHVPVPRRDDGTLEGHVEESAVRRGKEPAVPKRSSSRKKRAAVTNPPATGSARGVSSKSAATPEIRAHAAQIANELRSLTTEAEGAELLAGIKANLQLVRAIGAELGLKLGGTNKPEAVQKVLTQAIGARQKFAGLRQW